MIQLRDKSEKRGRQNEEWGVAVGYDSPQHEIVRNSSETDRRDRQYPAEIGYKGEEPHAQEDDKAPWQLCKWW